MKYLLIILAILFILAFGWFASVANERGEVYKANEAKMKARIDSLNSDLEAMNLDFVRLDLAYKQRGDSLRKIRTKNQALTKRYETLRNQPVEHLTDSAIVNQINKLYEQR